MKTLDHAFNADGLRKSGAKLEKAAEIRANLRTGWLRANKHETGVNKKSMGQCRACPSEESAMARTAPVLRRYKNRHTKRRKVTRYDIFELEGEERRTDKRRA